MGASKQKQINNAHTKAYVQAVFANRLREEGFLSFEDRDISWYNFKNGEIINTVIFLTKWNILPLFLQIGYGVYPLFSEIFLPRSVYGQEGYCQECCTAFFITENPQSTLSPFAPGIDIYAPMGGGRGLYMFNEVILPKLNSINNIHESYLHHKNIHIESTRKYPEYRYRVLSEIFIDEALYVDDSEVYPYCEREIGDRIRRAREHCLKSPNNSAYKKELAEWELRKQVFDDRARNEYLEILEQRKQKNIAMLKKRHGIIVPEEGQRTGDGSLCDPDRK